MSHTKDLIIAALKELHEEYNPTIKNPCYRGPMEAVPTFTIKQIAEKIGRTAATTRKWCNILYNEGKLKRGWKKCYFANDPMTYIFCLDDAQPIQLIPMR